MDFWRLQSKNQEVSLLFLKEYLSKYNPTLNLRDKVVSSCHTFFVNVHGGCLECVNVLRYKVYNVNMCHICNLLYSTSKVNVYLSFNSNLYRR